MKIGFVGQGFIGKNYALDFERRGFQVIRYSKEEPYIKNRDKIAQCDIVFVAVPTPTINKKFSTAILEEALKVVGKGATVVIKSTILPGTTAALQKKFPKLFILNSPEFLTEKTAAHDAAHPARNIVGILKNTPELRKRAKRVMSILPKAPYQLICSAQEAELIKYAGNCFLYTKVIYINLLFDLAQKIDCDWHVISEALSHDGRIGTSHLNPIHQSGTDGSIGRGAGGHCFIKDFSAFAELYLARVNDPEGQKVLRALEEKNINLLIQTHKDAELLKGVYGKKRIAKGRKTDKKASR